MGKPKATNLVDPVHPLHPISGTLKSREPVSRRLQRQIIITKKSPKRLTPPFITIASPGNEFFGLLVGSSCRNERVNARQSGLLPARPEMCALCL